MPPYWPLNKRWEGPQVAKAWILVLDMAIFGLTAGFSKDPGSSNGLTVFVAYCFFFIVMLVLTLVSLIVALQAKAKYNKTKLSEQYLGNRQETEPHDKHWLRNLLFIAAIVGPVVSCIRASLPVNLDSIGDDMVLVEGGTMTINWGIDAEDDEPTAQLVMVQDFYICDHEVTVGEWNAVMDNKIDDRESVPVSNVTQEQCQQFIDRLNAKTGKHYRLPTEAEWEYAARGGEQSHGYKYSGGNDFEEVAYILDCPTEQGLDPVRSRAAYELGLYDMSGGVWEWTNNPDVLRGGSAIYECDITCRRFYGSPKDPYSDSDDFIGFRLAMDAE